jgi:DNA-binding NtrC family response regulator
MAPHLSLSRMLRPEDGFLCRRNSWNSFSAEELNRLNSKLVLAVAFPETAEAISFLRSGIRRPGRIPTLAVIPGGSSEELLRTASDGADDFMLWPIREPELRERVKRLIGNFQDDKEAAHRSLVEELGLAQVVGSTPAFVEVLSQLARMAPSDAPILITGETGTGKEVCARSIHHLSRRRQGPFVPVDCGAIPEHLAESELFGHIRGAFTDAHRDRKGLVALADTGTLFLDEIDMLSLPTQAKMLRFIQEHTYRPVGAEQFSRANVRVITATNRKLEECVREKAFRSDLFFRLNVLCLPLPPLRERREDIEPLARHFLEKLTDLEMSEPRSLSHAALRRLASYDWPGNVRELGNVIQRAIVLAPGAQILPSHIVLSTGDSAQGADVEVNFRSARSKAIAAFERQYVQEILEKHHGNITHAARYAGQDRRAFGRLAKKYRALAGL